MEMRAIIQPFSGKWVWWFRGMCRLIIVVITLTGVPQLCYAERRQDVHGDIIALGAQRAEGKIYRIDNAISDNGEKLIVIDESIFTVDSSTVFRTISGDSANFSYFEVGDTVNYYFVDSLLTKMWEANPDETNIDTSKSEIKSDDTQGVRAKEIYMEDGVWKN